MLFWKREKFSEEELEEIAEEYLSLTKETVERCLPRDMRRALRKSKEWRDLSRINGEDMIEDIKQNGLNDWLVQTMREVYRELAPLVPDATRLEEELKKMLKEFKKKWKI